MRESKSYVKADGQSPTSTLIVDDKSSSGEVSSSTPRRQTAASSMDNFLKYARTVLSSAVSDTNLHSRQARPKTALSREQIKAIGHHYPSDVAGFKPKQYARTSRK